LTPLRIAAWVLTLCIVTTAQAQTNLYRRKITTLPMIKLGESDPRAKALPHYKPSQRSPPAWDPYRWIEPAEQESEKARPWTLASGTNITATLVKFNKLTVIVRLDNDREASLSRAALDRDGKTFVAKLEKEHEAARIEAWKKDQEEKADP